MSEETKEDQKRDLKRPELIPAPAPGELGADELAGGFDFGAEAELAAGGESPGMLGQKRALDAVRLAIGIAAPGYNVFVSGLRTREERQAVVRLIQEQAAAMPTPSDWVYVNNFKSPESPVAIYLEAGRGVDLRERMRELVEFVVEQLPKAFRREDFDRERAALREKYNRRAQELFGAFEARAQERGFSIQGTPAGQVVFVPLIGGKMPESPEDLAQKMAAMPEAERERLTKAQSELQTEMGNLVIQQQEMMRELADEIRAIERAAAARLITPAIAGLKTRFPAAAVAAYLDQVGEHMLQGLERFLAAREHRPPEPASGPHPGPAEEALRFIEYQVNVLVDNSGLRGAPVISEDAPTYRNLFGTIERWIDAYGRGTTNFMRIMAGSFLKSHGGFLVFDLEDAVVEPGVWKMLKRSLKTGRLTPETYEPLPFFGLSGLKPEPIGVANKVIVIGSPYLYNLLYFYDLEFSELFKVKAEIRPVVPADQSAARHYAARVTALARREGLPPFDAGALGAIVRFGMRLAGDRRRLLSLMEPIDDLAREAAFFARAEGRLEVGAAEVERALSERMLRLNFIEEEIRRLIAEGILIVEVDGAKVAQVNGLAVLDVGGYSFGRPSRVTASVALGQAGVINIEREARLSGSTHDKGMMILAGFLRGRFGQKSPPTMTASICFEQSYSGIDGDSASSTELYALLSALSGVPIRQDLAVTGSVDQFGTVQAIGAPNQKIEGFYRVCKALGLTSRQGVLVPRANLTTLLLDPETVAAVRRGEFHIYPVDNVDQGIEILTGVRAGTVDEPGTVNFLVAERLRQMAELLGERRIGDGPVVQVVQPAAPAAPAPPRPPEPPA